jgi:hypothetical protein
MSSTESDALAALYENVIAPAAARARETGATPFPTAPDATVESYYVRRPRAAMRREDFAAPSSEGFDDFASRLADHWRALGRDDLAAQAPRFADAARAVYALREDGADVSPFVYVMF